MTKILFKDGKFFIDGQIDEFFDYKMFDGIQRPLKLDLAHVKNCNSLGVREFLKFVRLEAPIGLEFHRCSLAVMDMINSIPSSLGSPPRPEIVKSLVLSYRCMACSKDETFVMEVTPGKAAGIPELPMVSCSRCRTGMAPLIEAEDVFTYLMAED